MNSQVLAPCGFRTSLAGDITAGATTVNVAASTGFPGSGNYTILVDQEQMTVTAGQGTKAWTVTRAAGGTTAVAHLSQAIVEAVPVASGQVAIGPTSGGAAIAVSCPPGAAGFFISVLTQDCRVSFDGTTATSTNGVAFKAGSSEPAFFPIAKDLSIIGLNASASDVSILWVK